MKNLKTTVQAVLILILSISIFLCAVPFNAEEVATNETAVVEGDDIPDVEPESYVASPLAGKVIYADGDSITRGARISVASTLGVRPTYSALTAYRNDACVINNAISSTTMSCATLNGKEYTPYSSRIYKRYLQAPAGVDYLTLWFGWNDNHVGQYMMREQWLKKMYGKTIYYPLDPKQIGKGKFATAFQKESCDKAVGYINGKRFQGADYFNRLFIGDEHSTSRRTFWGAYSFVLKYLTTSPKYKNTKIGIVVPYGCTKAMRNAVRRIARKFGVYCLDLYADNQRLFYGKESGFKYYTKAQIRRNRRVYLADGTHPNRKGHRVLSYIYEDWLKSM